MIYFNGTHYIAILNGRKVGEFRTRAAAWHALGHSGFYGI